MPPRLRSGSNRASRNESNNSQDSTRSSRSGNSRSSHRQEGKAVEDGELVGSDTEEEGGVVSDSIGPAVAASNRLAGTQDDRLERQRNVVNSLLDRQTNEGDLIGECIKALTAISGAGISTSSAISSSSGRAVNPAAARLSAYLAEAKSPLDVNPASDRYLQPIGGVVMNSLNQRSTPWCLTPAAGNNNNNVAGANIYPFSIFTSHAKALATQIRDGLAVDVSGFWQEGATSVAGAKQEEIKSQYITALPFRPIYGYAASAAHKIDLSASNPIVFITCFMRYIEAVSCQWPEQRIPMSRYLQQLLTLALAMPWPQVMAFDMEHRTAVARLGHSIDSIDDRWVVRQLETSACMACLVPCRCKNNSSSGAVAAGQNKQVQENSKERKTCWAFNGRGCKLEKCKFEHKCSICGGNHSKQSCSLSSNEKTVATGKRKNTNKSGNPQKKAKTTDIKDEKGKERKADKVEDDSDSSKNSE